MKVRGTISKPYIQLAFGLVLGLFVLSQSAAYSINTQTEEVKEEQKSKEGNTEQYIKLADAVPSSSTQINIDYQSFLLEELTLDDVDEEPKPVRFDIPLGKALKVLFRQIISPNAP